jgi:hypothetical protein
VQTNVTSGRSRNQTGFFWTNRKLNACKNGSEQLKYRMAAVIKKVQEQYNSDKFGFGIYL